MNRISGFTMVDVDRMLVELAGDEDKNDHGKVKE